jgi:hypothetical protein
MKRATEDWLQSADCDLLIVLDQLYIDARYPGEFGLLPHGKPSLSEVRIFYDQALQILNIVKETCISIKP